MPEVSSADLLKAAALIAASNIVGPAGTPDLIVDRAKLIVDACAKMDFWKPPKVATSATFPKS